MILIAVAVAMMSAGQWNAEDLYWSNRMSALPFVQFELDLSQKIAGNVGNEDPDAYPFENPSTASNYQWTANEEIDVNGGTGGRRLMITKYGNVLDEQAGLLEVLMEYEQFYQDGVTIGGPAFVHYSRNVLGTDDYGYFFQMNNTQQMRIFRISASTGSVISNTNLAITTGWHRCRIGFKLNTATGRLAAYWDRWNGSAWEVMVPGATVGTYADYDTILSVTDRMVLSFRSGNPQNCLVRNIKVERQTYNRVVHVSGQSECSGREPVLEVNTDPDLRQWQADGNVATLSDPWMGTAASPFTSAGVDGIAAGSFVTPFVRDYLSTQDALTLVADWGTTGGIPVSAHAPPAFSNRYSISTRGGVEQLTSMLAGIGCTPTTLLTLYGTRDAVTAVSEAQYVIDVRAVFDRYILLSGDLTILFNVVNSRVYAGATAQASADIRAGGLQVVSDLGLVPIDEADGLTDDIGWIPGTLPDGIHPNGACNAVLAERYWLAQQGIRFGGGKGGRAVAVMVTNDMLKRLQQAGQTLGGR